MVGNDASDCVVGSDVNGRWRVELCASVGENLSAKDKRSVSFGMEKDFFKREVELFSMSGRHRRDHSPMKSRRWG